MRLTRHPALRQTLLYALGILIMKGVSLFMLPYVAHHLSPEAFGRLEVLTSLAALGSLVVGFGLVDALYRFSADAADAVGRQRLAAQTLGLGLVLALMALVFALLCAQALTQLLPAQLHTTQVRLILLTLALEGAIAIPLGWLRLEARAGQFFLINTGKALLQAALVVWLLHLGHGLDGVLWAGFVAALLQALVLLHLQWRQSGIHLAWRRTLPLLRYGAPLVASGVIAFALTGLDRWLLADAIGPVALAHYALAAKFALIAALLLQPFGLWWFPKRFNVLRGPDGQAQAARFAAMGSALALLIAVVVGLGAPLVVAGLFPTDYAPAAHYAPWLVLLMALKEAAAYLNLGCYSGDSTRDQLYINLLGSAVGLLGMWLLLPGHGVAGLLLALFLAQGLRLWCFIAVSQRRLPLPYPARALALYALCALGALLLGAQVEAAVARAGLLLVAMLSLGWVGVWLRLLPGPRLGLAAQTRWEASRP